MRVRIVLNICFLARFLRSRFEKAFQWAMSRLKRASGSVPVPLPLSLGWLAWLAWASGAFVLKGLVGGFIVVLLLVLILLIVIVLLITTSGLKMA